MYIAFFKRIFFYSPFVPNVSSVPKYFEVYHKNIICDHQVCDCAYMQHYIDRL